jgi:hypothetical protein
MYYIMLGMHYIMPDVHYIMLNDELHNATVDSTHIWNILEGHYIMSSMHYIMRIT